jgi:PAS domain S-box-containing protein
MVNSLKDISFFPIEYFYEEFPGTMVIYHRASFSLFFLFFFVVSIAVTTYLLKRKVITSYRPLFWQFASFSLFYSLNCIFEATYFWHKNLWLTFVTEVSADLVSIFIVFSLIKIFLKKKISPVGALSNQHYAWIIESVDVGIVSFDLKGTCLSYNKGLEKIFGYTAEEIIGRPIEEISSLFTSNNQENIDSLQKFKAASRGCEKQPFEVQRRTKDGRLVTIRLSYNPILNNKGIKIGIVWIIKDITRTKNLENVLEKQALELKEINQSLKKRNKNLNKENKSLHYFTYAASHDLKSPVRIIHNFSYLLAEHLKDTLTPQAKELLKLISNQAKNMGKLIDDLLTYARLDIQNYPAEEIDMDHLIHETLTTIEKPASFQVKVQPSLPKILSFKTPLKQIVYNLISNAVSHHHHPDLGVISITGETKKNKLIFKVSENGPGISKKYHKKIFEPFQSVTSSQTSSNNGMGLNLVKKILEKHKGKIKITSKEGKGTSFEITWPLEIKQL